ncbi:MAG: FecR family protein [Colwellia sp.]|nr:FecR family protein [Colwellia sp.]
MSKIKNIVTLPSIESIEAEAASWITVLGREKVTKADMSELKLWLKQSERHRNAFNELTDLWDNLTILKELDDIAESVSTLPDQQSIFWQRRSFLAIAASIFICFIISGSLYWQHLTEFNQQARLITAVGEQRTVILSDGSTVQINTNSQLEIDFSRDKRIIRLLKGEAYFTVAKNKQRPFYVYAGGGLVQAIGTAFNVRLKLFDEIEVTVEEGLVALATLVKKVPITSSNIELISSSAPETETFLAELSAGQSTTFSHTVDKIELIQTPALNRKLAWRQGVLAYANEPLLKVIADISRYTNITIEIADPSLRTLPIAGYFRVGEVEALFDSLEITFGLEVKRISKNYVRLSTKS